MPGPDERVCLLAAGQWIGRQQINAIAGAPHLMIGRQNIKSEYNTIFLDITVHFAARLDEIQRVPQVSDVADALDATQNTAC